MANGRLWFRRVLLEQYLLPPWQGLKLRDELSTCQNFQPFRLRLPAFDACSTPAEQFICQESKMTLSF